MMGSPSWPGGRLSWTGVSVFLNATTKRDLPEMIGSVARAAGGEAEGSRAGARPGASARAAV